MKQFLISKLVDPYSGEELIISPENDFLKTTNGNKYFIKNNIAVMIDVTRQVKKYETELHKNFDSNFDYKDHYETDAVQFDYFNDDEPYITKNERRRSRQAIINAVPKNTTVSLYDLSGKLLVDETIKASQTKINIQNFSEGIYFLRLSTPYKTENFKIIIQK